MAGDLRLETMPKLRSLTLAGLFRDEVIHVNPNFPFVWVRLADFLNACAPAPIEKLTLEFEPHLPIHQYMRHTGMVAFEDSVLAMSALRTLTFAQTGLGQDVERRVRRRLPKLQERGLLQFIRLPA